MRRLTDTMGAVLLAASLLLNAALLLRRVPQDPLAAATQDPVRDLQLAAEREQNAALSAQLRELEAARATSPSPAAPAASSGIRAARLRERFHRYVRLCAQEDAYMVPTQRLAMTEATQQPSRAVTRRAQDPAAYAECLKELFEAILLDTKLELSPDQSKALQGILDTYREGLAVASPEAVHERQLLDLQAEGVALNRASELLSEAQNSRLNYILGGLGIVSAGSQYSVAEAELPEKIADNWTSMYGLEEAQAPAVTAAARGLADTLRRISRPLLEKREGDTESQYEIRVQSLRAQGEALKLLENILTPTQIERIRSVPLGEYEIERRATESDK